MNDTQVDFHLHKHQLAVFTNPARFKVLVAGRRFGKTYLAVVTALTKALDPANTKKKDVWLVAPTFNQAKAVMWNLLTDLGHPVIDQIRVNEGVIRLINGVQVCIKGSDRPDSLRGVGLYYVVVDEYATMKPDVWETILRPSLADVKGGALFIGTPAGRNHFYSLALEAKKNLTGEWQLFRFHSIDNPFLDPTEIESAKSNLSSAAFRQEFMASFESGGTDLFKADWLKYSEEEPKTGNFYIAVDLAGFADVKKAALAREQRLDQTVIAVVKVSETGDWWVADMQYGRWNVRETAKKIINAVAKYEPTLLGIEKGALMNAVMPYLTEESHRLQVSLRIETLTHGNKNKTDRIMWALQGRFEHGRVTLNSGEWNAEFVDQLTHFPSTQIHDDMPDALSYIDQLITNHNFSTFEDLNAPYWQPQDVGVGY